MTTTAKASLINVALNKPATQSSMSRWSTPDEAAKAVNGVKSGEHSFHTDYELNPWWQVDLGEIYTVASICIYNRGRKDTPMANRAKSIGALISCDGVTWERILSGGLSFGGALDNSPLSLNCQGKKARYVKLQLEETNYLHLDEVEVLATPGKSKIKNPKSRTKH